MADIAAAALQVQIRALIDSWQRDLVPARAEPLGLRGAEGRDLASYYAGYADALDRCMQALKLLDGQPATACSSHAPDL